MLKQWGVNDNEIVVGIEPVGEKYNVWIGYYIGKKKILDKIDNIQDARLKAIGVMHKHVDADKKVTRKGKYIVDSNGDRVLSMYQ